MSEPSLDEKPPLFTRWRSWYWLVIIMLSVELAFFLYVTLSFS